MITASTTLASLLGLFVLCQALPGRAEDLPVDIAPGNPLEVYGGIAGSWMIAEQLGDDNHAIIAQSLAGENGAWVVQNGHDNEIAILQSHAGGVGQHANVVRFEQQGTGSDARIIQQGVHNVTDVVIRGNHTSADLLQTGEHNYIVGRDGGALAMSGDGISLNVRQIGSFNLLIHDLALPLNDTNLSVTQIGDGAQARVSQY